MSSRLGGLGLAFVAAVLAAGCVTNNEPSHPMPDAPKSPDAPPGTPDAPPNACGNLAGRWGVDGTCGGDLCTITQGGCSITALTCDSGAHSTSGSITGNQFTYAGVTRTGTPATCSGTIAGNMFAGSCTVVGVMCQFSRTRL